MSEEHRFSRIELLLGREAVARLSRASAAVCGLGAVGSSAVEALARSGLGRLRLVDFDVVRPSNINRQLFALESSLGRAKVEVARERVRDINPACVVEALPLFLDNTTVAGVVRGVDVVVDAIDSVNPKVALLEAAVRAGVPVVSAMGAATRTDPLALRVGDLSETQKCPLARFIRRKLRKKGICSGVRCVYSIEPARKEARALEPACHEAPARRGRPRAPLGSLCPVPAVFGLIAAREAIAIVLGELFPTRR